MLLGHTRQYSHTPVPKVYPGSSPWTCRCPVRKSRRHKDPPDCLGMSEVERWRERHLATCSEKTARVLTWLAKEFVR